MTERPMVQIGLAASLWHTARQRRLAAGRAKNAAQAISDLFEKQHPWPARNPFWQPARAATEVLQESKLRERKALRALDKLCAQHVTADADDVEDLATLPRLVLPHTTS